MPRRIRVFHLIKGLGRGGAELLLLQALRCGDRARFQYGFGYFLPWKDAVVAELEAEGGEVTCFHAGGNLAILRSTRRVARHLEAWGADLLHCHLPLAGVVGRRAGRRAGVGVVYTEHNTQERYRFLTRTLNALTWRRQDHVIAVSEGVAASIAARMGSAVPVTVVPNGIDVERFRPQPEEREAMRRRLGIEPGAPVVGTVAVFRVQKALHDWLAAARLVLQRRPDARFLLVGDGPLRAELEAAASAEGLSGSVRFAGLQDDVRPFLAAMDAYLMTSIFEGLPVALLEAMAMERPVVVTPVGGIPEVVRPDENGVLVPAGSPERAAEAVLALLADPERAARLARSARRTIAEGFGARAMVRRVEAIYEEVLSGHGG